MKLSDKIRIIRKARGFSQETLGEKLSRTSQYGISRQSISDWENGKTEPKLENIQKITEALGSPIAALLDIDETDQALNTLSDFKNVDVKQTQYPDMFNLKELESYFTLNRKGKDKALSYIDDLAKLPEYTSNES